MQHLMQGSILQIQDTCCQNKNYLENYVSFNSFSCT